MFRTDPSVPSPFSMVCIGIAAAAAVAGSLVALHYHQLGLTLAHYDARGHLVVARRIIDSLTPGWQQIGAVWLPLPHVLNAIPVQVDAFYRSGASAVAISIVAYAVATGAIASIVLTLTRSPAAALAGAAVFALNPNVLYLQSTPMTELLLIALLTVSMAMSIDWINAARLKPRAPEVVDAEGARGTDRARGFSRAAAVGWMFALACLTRYEAWPVTACALVAAVWARWRRGEPFATACRDVAAIARYPALAIVAFSIFSRVVIGEWLLAGDFFVPENKALNDPVMAAAEIWWGVRTLSGGLLAAIGATGLVVSVVIGSANRRRGDMLVALSLLATAAVPWLAFLDGHPFRIRYMVPLIAVEAIGAGLLAGVWGSGVPGFRGSGVPGSGFRVRGPALAAAVLILAVAAYELRPFDTSAPMVVEAQWDRPNSPARARVTDCLGPPGSGRKIMASMGSLGHYMQEASRAGFSIRDFLHEGNGDIWLAALDGPQRYADRILIEEKAEGGDMLAKRARTQPSFLAGYERVCDGAGLALYQRAPRPSF